MKDQVIGNRATKKAHSSKRNDACRTSEIKPANRRPFANIQEAEAAGFTRCKLCFRVGKTDLA